MSKLGPVLDDPRARRRFSAAGVVALLLALCAPGVATAASWTDAKPAASWTDVRPGASWTDARASASWTDRVAPKRRTAARHH
jgi:DMSO/TMAO reductase YedYZ molybdopterin-dependent catalytic subunit